ncbi:S-adenosyl-L-methionine-dependent methyltransferase [Coprinopsis sp. MPI-PUGE-AT-0042]|nr:S-adenosyl-L-methionine-dependent methyltransferase [Coprinopsis sp. MPI-PUGE-AT-0042]
MSKDVYDPRTIDAQDAKLFRRIIFQAHDRNRYNRNEFENLLDSSSDEHPRPCDLNSPYTVGLTDDDSAQYYAVINGRLYHTDLSAPYPLPVDGPELNRYKACHNILKRLLGGNYIGPVQDILAPSPTEQKRVLDICNGDGQWVIEMCEEFPHVQFEGLDLVPNSTRLPPDNALFVLDDASRELDYADESFHLVHARDASMAITNYTFLIQEVARVLKPGGMFLTVEWDRRPSFPAGSLRHLEIDAPASIRFHQTLDQALHTGVGVHPSPRQCSALLAASHHFVNVETRSLTVPIIPIGGSHENPQLARIGGWVRSTQVKLARACERLLLLHTHLSQAEVERLTEDYVRELRSVHGLIATFYVAYGTRV